MRKILPTMSSRLTSFCNATTYCMGTKKGIHIHTYTYTHIQIPVATYTDKHTHTPVTTRIHGRTHKHRQTHTHTHTDEHHYSSAHVRDKEPVWNHLPLRRVRLYVCNSILKRFNSLFLNTCMVRVYVVADAHVWLRGQVRSYCKSSCSRNRSKTQIRWTHPHIPFCWEAWRGCEGDGQEIQLRKTWLTPTPHQNRCVENWMTVHGQRAVWK